MKRILYLLLTLALLSAVYFGYIQKNTTSGKIHIADRDFIVKNIEDVNTITIKSKGYPLIHLNLGSHGWVLNQKYKADIHIVNNMLGVLSTMHINYIPPKSQNEMIQKSIKNVGIEIKTYDKKGKIITDFIMAGNTNSEDGTYCINAGASQAYVMSRPIVVGGLRNYFTHDVIALRDKTVFSFNTDKIESISVHYPKDTKNSFILNKVDDQFELSTFGKAVNNKVEANVKLIQSYVQKFNRLMSENIGNNNPACDTIKNKIPFAVINIASSSEKPVELKFFPDMDIYDKTVNTQSIENLGQVDRYFVESNWSDCYIVQHKLVSKCLKSLKYFEGK